MSGISVSAIILTQLDKVILSKLLSLEMFGYYTLAGVASSVVPVMLVGPMFNALFPRFTSLVAMNDEPRSKLLYHQGSQLMAVLVLPVAAVLAFFSFDILLLWTGSARNSQNCLSYRQPASDRYGFEWSDDCAICVAISLMDGPALA